LARNLEPIKKSNYLVTGEHWAIIIGISNYKDPKLNLNYAHRDAEEIYNILIKSNDGPFAEDHITKLINNDATYSKIRKALRNFLKKPDKDDLVLIYFSCHGAPDPDRPNNTYILPYDTDPDDIASTALHMGEIQSAIHDNLLSKKIIIIADTCHSAAIGGDIGRRNVKNSSEIINRYFDELAKSKEGTALITSAEANEVAFEDKKWGNGHGVFTHFLLEGLRGKADGYGGGKKDGIVSVGELFEYVRDNVKKHTDNKQHPSIGTSPYDRNLPLYFMNIVFDSKTDFSSYILNLLQNGQIKEFNNLRIDYNNQQINLPNIDLSGKDLYAIDLHEAILTESIFKEAKMKDVNLTGAILSRADLTGADLRFAHLADVKLDGAKLINAQLQGADLKGIIDFSNANLTGADLRGLDLEGEVNFDGAILHNVSFVGSNLVKASLKLDGADMKNVTGLEIKKSFEPLAKEKYDNKFDQGMIILGSSHQDHLSKEKNNCVHSENDPPHSHGAFSYHLIEGLEGKAADADTGIISIDSLKRYIEKQMLAEQKQKPIYSIGGASNFGNIKIAIYQGKFEAKIQSLINEAMNLLGDQSETFKNIFSLYDAAKKVNEIRSLIPDHPDIPKLISQIDKSLYNYKEPTINWLDSNIMVAAEKINEIGNYFYSEELPDLVYSLSFNTLVTLSNSYVKALYYILSHVKQNTQFEKSDDPKLLVLVKQLRVIFDNEIRDKRN
jgi:uncharacterized caspase-like protein